MPSLRADFPKICCSEIPYLPVIPDGISPDHKQKTVKVIFTGPATSAWQMEFQAVAGRRRVGGVDVLVCT